jgi:ABC-type polysaccharide/polyol phosphate export permease
MKRLEYNLNLIKELAWADFKLKYYGSVLGLFWSFLKPFLMLIILYIVFTTFINTGIENFHIYLLLGIVFWNFFADGTKDSMESIRGKSQIVQNAKVSGVTIVLSTCLHSLMTFFVNLGIFFIVYFSLGFTLSLSAVTLLYLVILYVFLVVGVSHLITLLNMKFTDFGHIWDVFLQLLFWGSPIVYSLSGVPATYNKIFLLNPVARIIVDARNSVMYHFFPEAKQLVITTAIILFIFVISLALFRKYYRGIVDRI